ncbi:DUF3265 domain-containing protein [Vibrio harveyi]
MFRVVCGGIGIALFTP